MLICPTSSGRTDNNELLLHTNWISCFLPFFKPLPKSFTMLLAKLIVVVLLGVALAEPEGEHETRQISVIPNSCTSTFQLATNPCASGQGRVYYPVPNDPHKFVQCDNLGRAYVVQCPTGLYFDQVTTSCQAQQQPVVSTVTSPCTAQAMTTGQIYHAYNNDNTRFYECTGIGQAQLLSCPQHSVWDQNRLACVYPPGTAVSTGTGVIVSSTQQFTNPCTQQQLLTHQNYFAHPDPTRFIQCGPAGEAYVMTCPNGLVWNQYSETCISTFSGTILV